MRRAGSWVTWTAATAALLGLLSACGGGPSRGRTAAPSVPGTSAPASAGTAGPYGWTRDTSAALALGGGATATLAAVLPPQTPRGWLVAGTRTAADGTTTAVVWSSPDAVHWTATALTGPGVDSQARAATTWGSRTVVVGSVGRGADQRAAVWLAARPGEPFVAVPDTTVFTAAGPATAAAARSAGGATMDVVAAGALGLFASGSVAGQVALWYSTNGQHWIRLTEAEKLLAESPGARVNALLVTGDGVHAAGSVRDGAVTDAALWTSSDGIHWQPVQASEGAFSGAGDHVITGLAELGTGYVAVGATRSGTRWVPASWISPDGTSWSQPSGAFPLGGPAGPGDGGTVVRAVTATPTGPTTTRLVAVGGSDQVQRAWTSTDGLSWTEVGLPPGAAGSAGWRATLVAADRPQLVIADGDPGQPHLLSDGPGGWAEPSADPATFGPVRTAARPGALLAGPGGLFLAVDVVQPAQQLGATRTTVAILRSTDGVGWTVLAQGGPFDGGTVSGLLATASRLIAVGSRGSGAASSPAIWSSTDAGRTWAVLAPPQGGSGAATSAEADAVAALGATAVVVGRGTPATPAGATGGLAVSWAGEGGGSWLPAVALDPEPGLDLEEAFGVCAADGRVAAVGVLDGTGPARDARAWVSADGRRWSLATVSPAAQPGTAERMAGCVGGPGGFVAYGATTTSDGATVPALWRSPDGRHWTRQDVETAGAGGSAPVPPGGLGDLARAGRVWLATGGPGRPATSTLPGSQLGLWRSSDSGKHWQRLDTGNPVWQGDGRAALDRVAFAHGEPVVAGEVDGQLAVWVGNPGA